MVMIIFSILMCYNILIISCLWCQFLVARTNIGGVHKHVNGQCRVH